MACSLLSSSLSLFSLIFPYYMYFLSLTHTVLSLSLSLSLSLFLHTISCSVCNHTHRLSQYLLPSQTFFTDKMKKKKHAALTKHVFPRRECSLFQKKKKRKKRKEQPKLHDLAFLLILLALQPALIFCSCSVKSWPSYLYPQSHCLSSSTK